MQLHNHLSAAGSLCMLLFAQHPMALPGAPMLPLEDACPSCAAPSASERRPVILHPAFGRVIENQLPDWAELLAHTLTRYQETGVLDARLKDTQRRLAEWTRSPEIHHRLPRAEASRVHTEPLPAAVREALSRGTGSSSALAPDFRRIFLFFDADDDQQLAWAAEAVKASEEAAQGEIRLVLRQGSLSRAAEALTGERLYFDQGGALSRRLHVLALPARACLTPSGIRTEAVALPADAGPQHSEKPQKFQKP